MANFLHFLVGFAFALFPPFITLKHKLKLVVTNTRHSEKALFNHLQIERWWRELHKRFEQYFKQELSWLLNQDHYDHAIKLKIKRYLPEWEVEV